jgi:iron complex outermembrane recepter protein
MRISRSLFLSVSALISAPAIAQNVEPADEDVSGGDEIIVFGQGQTRQVQEINSEDITILAPR